MDKGLTKEKEKKKQIRLNKDNVRVKLIRRSEADVSQSCHKNDNISPGNLSQTIRLKCR